MTYLLVMLPAILLFVAVLLQKKEPGVGPGWVTFTCTRCRFEERHHKDNLDLYHAAHAVCPRCGGQQSVSGW